MRKYTLVASTALGIVIGGVLLNATPAYADWPVIDVASIAKEVQQIGILNNLLSVFNSVQSAINSLLGPNGPIASLMGNNAYGTVQQLLQEGFTQEANYSKASIGAQEQVTDASNEAMAQFDLQVRDAQIRDQQTASPAACVALDGGVSAQAAAIQSYRIGDAISLIQDQRTEALPKMPSHFGLAQGVAAADLEHLTLYCDQDDEAAGLCSTYNPATADADQRFSSLFGSGTYTNQSAVDTANDYAVNLIEPVAPAALRGDQLSSIEGQTAALYRRSYDARISLAQGILAQDVAVQAPSVPLTTQQQQYLQSIGITGPKGVPPTTGSMLEVLQIEAERRFSSVEWAAYLQSMPPASVEREIATELALNNYLLFHVYKSDLEANTLSATQLAERTQHDFMPTSQMPVPSLSASNAP